MKTEERKTERTIDGLTVEVKVEIWTAENTSYADGENVKVGGSKSYRLSTISITRGSVSASAKASSFFALSDRGLTADDPNAYAMFGRQYISKSVYDIIKIVVDDAMIGNSTDHTDDDQDDSDNGSTRCPHCHTYCCGDCLA